MLFFRGGVNFTASPARRPKPVSNDWPSNDEAATNPRKWGISVLESPLRSSCSFCYGLWCSCCMVATQRMDVLEVVGEPYACCGGMYSCQPLSDEWDLTCVWCEAFCCCACGLVANRFLLQTRFNLENSSCDNCMIWTTCFIKYGMCLWQCCCSEIFLIPQDVECCTDIAEVMVEACLLAQQAFELENVVARGMMKNPQMSAQMLSAPGQQSMATLIVPQLGAKGAVGCTIGAIGGGASGALALSSLGGPPRMGTARGKKNTGVNNSAAAAYNPTMGGFPPMANGTFPPNGMPNGMGPNGQMQPMYGQPGMAPGGPMGMPPGVGMPPGHGMPPMMGGAPAGMMGVVPGGPQPQQLGKSVPVAAAAGAAVGAVGAAAAVGAPSFARNLRSQSDLGVRRDGKSERREKKKSKKLKSRNDDDAAVRNMSTFCRPVNGRNKVEEGTDMTNFGPFLQLVAPNGIVWAEYCSGRPVEIEPNSGALTGNWGECMAWAKIYELQTPGWESDPDYSSMSPCNQVKDAIFASNPDVPRQIVEEACRVLQLTCQAAAKTGALVPTKSSKGNTNNVGMAQNSAPSGSGARAKGGGTAKGGLKNKKKCPLDSVLSDSDAEKI